MRKLCGICFVLLLVPVTARSMTISEEEWTRLMQNNAEQTSINEQRAKDLIESKADLAKSEKALEKSEADLAASRAETIEAENSRKRTEKSSAEFVIAAEAALMAARQERDGWRICAVATGVVCIIAVIVARLLH